jgi:hypothetical protein
MTKAKPDALAVIARAMAIMPKRVPVLRAAIAARAVAITRAIVPTAQAATRVLPVASRAFLKDMAVPVVDRARVRAERTSTFAES